MRVDLRGGPAKICNVRAGGRAQVVHDWQLLFFNTLSHTCQARPLIFLDHWDKIPGPSVFFLDRHFLRNFSTYDVTISHLIILGHDKCDENTARHTRRYVATCTGKRGDTARRNCRQADTANTIESWNTESVRNQLENGRN